MSIESIEDDKLEPLELYDDRDIILSKLNEIITYLHKKALSGRISNRENEKVRIQWFKALVYTCNVYNNIKKEAELDEIMADISELKKEFRDMQKFIN